MNSLHPKDLPRESSRGILFHWRLSDPLERIYENEKVQSGTRQEKTLTILISCAEHQRDNDEVYERDPDSYEIMVGPVRYLRELRRDEGSRQCTQP